MGFIKRTERGGLSMRHLDLQILIDEIFYIAKDEEEVEWIRENLQGMIDISSEEKTDELEESNN